MTCKDCVFASQPTTTMRCINHGINMSDNAVVCNEFKGRSQTNADRIRAMTDEELAEFMAKNVGCNECPFFVTCRSAPQDRECSDRWLDWLQQEVRE